MVIRIVTFLAVIFLFPSGYASTCANSFGELSRQQLLESIMSSKGISPSANEIRLAKLKSIVGFFRGTNKLFYYDMYKGEYKVFFETYATEQIVLHGDDHVDNRMSHLAIKNSGKKYKSKREHLTYSMEDFDDSFIGPWALDLTRLVVNLSVVSEELGFNITEQKTVIQSAVSSFVKGLKSFIQTKEKHSRDDLIEELVLNIENTGKPLKTFLKDIKEEVGLKDFLKTWTKKTDDGSREFRSSGKISEKIKKLGKSQLKMSILKGIEEYKKGKVADFEVVDIARRVGAGVGAIKNDRFYVLIKTANGKYRVLEVKEQQGPSAHSYMNSDAKEAYERTYRGNHALQVVDAAQNLSEVRDPYIGWLALTKNRSVSYFTVMELSAYREKFPRKEYTLAREESENDDFRVETVEEFTAMAEIWAEMTLRSLLKSDALYQKIMGAQDKHVEDRVYAEIAGKEEEFTKDLTMLAISYKRRIQQDFDWFWTRD